MTQSVAFFSAFPTRFGVSRVADFYWLILSYIFIGAGAGLASTFTNLEVSDLHIFNPTFTSMDYAISGVGALCIYLWFPNLSRLLSLKKLLLLSSIISLAAVLLFIPFLQTDINFLIRFLLGGSLGLYYIAVNCYMSDLFDTPFRATLFGISAVASTLAYAFGSSLISCISTIWYIYAIAAGFFAITFCSLLFVTTPQPSLKKSNTSSQKKSTTPSQKNASLLRAFFVFPVFFIFCFLYGFGFSGEGKYFPIFAEGLGLIKGKAALLYSFSLLGAIVIIPLSSYFADKYGYTKILFIMTLAGVFLAAYTTFFPSLMTVVILFFLISGIISSFSSLSVAWLSEMLKGSLLLPMGMSLRSVLNKMGSILSPLLIGFFMATFDNVGFVYWITLGFCFCLVTMGIAAFHHRAPVKNTPP